MFQVSKQGHISFLTRLVVELTSDHGKLENPRSTYQTTTASMMI